MSPNQASLLDTLDYIYAEAKAGHFKGKGSGSAVLVLTYLARYSWRKVPKDKDIELGTVLSGKSAYEIMAADLSVGKNTVQRAMDWLDGNHWLTRVTQHDSHGYLAPYKIVLHLDTTGHMNRAEYRRVTAEAESFLVTN